ncbi:hypothetical protein B4U80_03442 [Leptotrombidium deliense]|uniref:Peptidase M12A domain-containing protein n=1 Tax=Leptotrombidium deliense TaxID=299467 RepID=A0A443RXV8_9ACAR|nr:hypothetical protein B4U80_03442 [Leptotrombidium deliense]
MDLYFYDYFSVMHYTGYHHAINTSIPVITAKCDGFNFDQNNKLSPLDINKINQNTGFTPTISVLDSAEQMMNLLLYKLTIYAIGIIDVHF